MEDEDDADLDKSNLPTCDQSIVAAEDSPNYDDIYLESDADLLNSLLGIPDTSVLSFQSDDIEEQSSHGSILKVTDTRADASLISISERTPQGNFHAPPVINSLPQPSPAACGKRKHAELAAAQMLAATASQDIDASSLTAEKARLPASSSQEESSVTVSDAFFGRKTNLSITNPDLLTGISGASTDTSNSCILVGGSSSSKSSNSCNSRALIPSTPWESDMKALSAFPIDTHPRQCEEFIDIHAGFPDFVSLRLLVIIAFIYFEDEIFYFSFLQMLSSFFGEPFSFGVNSCFLSLLDSYVRFLYVRFIFIHLKLFI